MDAQEDGTCQEIDLRWMTALTLELPGTMMTRAFTEINSQPLDTGESVGTRYWDEKGLCEDGTTSEKIRRDWWTSGQVS